MKLLVAAAALFLMFKGCGGGSSHSVVASWSKVPGATSYNVMRSPHGADGWIRVGVTTGTSFVDTSVASGLSYDYAETATNANGTSPLSNIETIKIP